MVEPPSRRLQQILLGLQLCLPRDLRRCASRVRGLSADLPAFDSVWIDALVQRRVLTSWQAQTIEADQPELLRIGPCVVEDRIGKSHRSATYLARLPDRKGQCVIKRVVVPAELRKGVNDRLKQLVERSQELSHSGIRVPHSFSEVSHVPLPELEPNAKLKENAATQASRRAITESTPLKQGSKSGVGQPRRKPRSNNRPNDDKLQSELAVVSRLVEGLSLSDVLLRRGRLPAADVDAIARQLLESLSVLHDAGIVHGEILLKNIRLTASGQVVLVDAGILPALQPEFQISAHISPEQNDGIAPELIGTGAAVSPRSDLYALGFALWQLLAGRPAFPTGDPLAKLAAHQTSRIPDICDFAPDTPERLAKAIEWLTEPIASRRPPNAQSLLADGSRGRNIAISQSTAKQESQSATAQNNSVTRTNLPERTPAENGFASRQPGPLKSNHGAASPFTIRSTGRTSRRRLSKFAASFQLPVRRNAQPSSMRKSALPLAFATVAVLLAIAALMTFDVRSRNLILTVIPTQLTATADYITSSGQSSSGLPSTGVTGIRDAEVSSGTSEAALDQPPSGERLPLRRDIQEVRRNSDVASQHEETARSTTFNSTTSHIPVSQSRTSQLIPLPEPDPYGVVLLSEPGNYEAGSIAWSGSQLVIRGLPDKSAQIVVTTRPLQLRATEITLENLRIKLQSATSSPATLTQIRSQKLTCKDCDFLTPPGTASADSASRPAALAAAMAVQWTPIDSSDPLAGELTFNNCILAGLHSTILLGAPGRSVHCANTLKLGGGPLFIATKQAAAGDNVFSLERTTLRNSGSLIAFDLRDGPPWKSRLTIRPKDCVFDLKPRTETESESLITFAGGQLQLTWYERVSIEGNRAVAGTTVGLAAWQATNGSGHQALDGSDVPVRGLIQTEFNFCRPPSHDPADSVLSDVQTNLVSSQFPGISTSKTSARSGTPNAGLTITTEPLILETEAATPEL